MSPRSWSYALCLPVYLFRRLSICLPTSSVICLSTSRTRDPGPPRVCASLRDPPGLETAGARALSTDTLRQVHVSVHPRDSVRTGGVPGSFVVSGEPPGARTWEDTDPVYPPTVGVSSSPGGKSVRSSTATKPVSGTGTSRASVGSGVHTRGRRSSLAPLEVEYGSRRSDRGTEVRGRDVGLVAHSVGGRDGVPRDAILFGPESRLRRVPWTCVVGGGAVVGVWTMGKSDRGPLDRGQQGLTGRPPTVVPPTLDVT